MLRVVVTDAVTGREQGRAELTRAATDTRGVVARGRCRGLRHASASSGLRVVASTPGDDSVRPSAPGDVTVDVRPATVRVDVLEARPTWAARFARLALSAVAGVELQTEVRVAPGITARTSSRGVRAGRRLAATLTCSWSAASTPSRRAMSRASRRASGSADRRSSS